MMRQRSPVRRPTSGPLAACGLVTLVALSLVVNSSGTPIPFYCRLNEVRCPSNTTRCIRALELCNGVKDCPDGSDETPALCKAYDCSNIDANIVRLDPYPPTYIKSLKCPSGNMCTKKFVLQTRNDEEPLKTYFQCTGGTKECADGSDEGPKFCKNLNCEDIEVHGIWAATCPSKKYCLYPKCSGCQEFGRDLLCDGNKDCPDGSDEWGSFCRMNGCGGNADADYRCSDGGCIREDQTCNGVKDCSTGGDESPALCAAYSCPWSGGAKCGDGRTCLRQLSVCDGKKNCPDGSDETPSRCRAYTCPAGTWKCKDGLQCAFAGDASAFNSAFSDPRCNNIYECKDKSDESSATCKNFNCVGFRNKKCPGNGACILERDLCDGKKDCLDGSDETSAGCKQSSCPKCKNGRCMQVAGFFGRKCDGRVECEDKSDEDPATCSTYVCPTGSTKCPNFPYQCVDNRYLCDGETNCINGGDEDATFCATFRRP